MLDQTNSEMKKTYRVFIVNMLYNENGNLNKDFIFVKSTRDSWTVIIFMVILRRGSGVHLLQLEDESMLLIVKDYQEYWCGSHCLTPLAY